MICEVVAIGTELLLGEIVDTNSSWIGQQLALGGIANYFQVKVGDNHERMVATLRDALERSDAVIVCGGLGPTQDDITRAAIAEVMNVGLERDETIVARITEMFSSRGREMPANNLLQADVPVGAVTIPQQPGTAPGLMAPVGDKVIYAVPGVPYEMKIMVGQFVVPDLQERAGISSVIRSRTLKTWGQSESGLAEMLATRIDELDRIGNPTLAFNASGVEGLKVRITASAADDAAAEAMLADEEAVIRTILGDLIFGADDDTMESIVVEALAAQGWSLAMAESITGGMMTDRLTSVADAHSVFRGSMVTGSDDGGGDVSEAGAQALAERVAQDFGADVAIASVGVGGPGGPEGVDIGTVFLAVRQPSGTETATVKVPGDRLRIRGYATISLMNMFRRSLPSVR